MVGARNIVVAFDLAMLAIVLVAVSPASGSLSTNPGVQLLVLGLLSGTCSLLFPLLAPKARSSLPVIAVVKALFLCLLFFLIPRGSSGFVLLWATFFSVLLAYLSLQVSLIVGGFFVAMTGLILASFPFLWPRTPAETVGSFLMGLATMATSGLLVVLRVQMDRLRVSEVRTANFEKDLRRLTEANVGFQEYSSLIEQHTLRAERDRISREIHDSTGYALTTLKMIFEAAKGLMQKDPAQVLGLMDQGITLSKDALEEVRAALRELRTQQDPSVEGLSFVVRLVKNFESVTKVRIEYDFTNTKQSYSPSVNALLYKMVQESLTNAYRHGRASWVRMILSETESDLQVSISDNGQFNALGTKGIGLQGMEERIRELGGAISFLPRKQGFEILASIPLLKEPTHA